jgi:hypothetical protein
MAMPVVVPPPTPVPTVPVPVPAVAPPDLLGLHMIDVVLGNDGRFYTLGARWREPLMRQGW